jgi:adenylate kinase family enzyme
MRKYVIMGVQGSGKGTQAALVKKDFDLVPRPESATRP